MGVKLALGYVLLRCSYFPLVSVRLTLSFSTCHNTNPTDQHNFPSTVSFLVAYMVAYLRKYRYRRFQRRRKGGDRTEEPAVGITGIKSVGLKRKFLQYRVVLFCPSAFTSFLSSAYEWQGHKKEMHPVSVELDEKRKLQIFDCSRSSNRCINLHHQHHLDVLLSNDRHRKALLLKVPKEYDLVSSRW